MQEFTDNLALRSQAIKDDLHTLGVGCTRLSKIVSSSHACLWFFIFLLNLSNQFS